MKREDVYHLIDGERNYQDGRWNEKTTTSKGLHSPTEFLVYMKDYIEEALHHLSRNPEQTAKPFALNNIRKIAGMAVSCMEQHGAPERTPEKL